MEDYAVPRRRNTLESVTVDLNFSVGFELFRGQHHHLSRSAATDSVSLLKVGISTGSSNPACG